MWDEILSALWPPRRKRRGPIVPNAPRPKPRVEETARTKKLFEAWGKKNAFLPTDDETAFVGRLLGREVVVRPGLAGSSPIGAEAEITIEHDESAVFLVTKKRPEAPDEAKSDVGEALVPLFDDPALRALRSIAVITSGVRLGFQPLTAPGDVQSAVDAAIRAVEERLRARPRANPFR